MIPVSAATCRFPEGHTKQLNNKLLYAAVFAQLVPVVVRKDAGCSKLDSEGLWKASADASKLSSIKYMSTYKKA